MAVGHNKLAPESLALRDIKLRPIWQPTVLCNLPKLRNGSAGNANYQINCSAPNGTPFAQSVALCEGMKKENIVIYTVGFNLLVVFVKFVLGPTALGFRHRDDVREITGLLCRLGIDVNVVAPMGATPEDLTRLPAADFNVSLYPEIADTAARWRWSGPTISPPIASRTCCARRRASILPRSRK